MEARDAVGDGVASGLVKFFYGIQGNNVVGKGSRVPIVDAEYGCKKHVDRWVKAHTWP